jgi:hypothetical protein
MHKCCWKSKVDALTIGKKLRANFRQLLATYFPKISFVNTSEIWEHFMHAPLVANPPGFAYLYRNEHGSAVCGFHNLTRELHL